MSSNQKGFAHILVLVLVAFLALSSIVPISRNYNNGISNVEGVSIAQADLTKVGSKLAMTDIRIATAPGQIALVNKKAGALSKFPLSINPTTGQLTVTTPAGVKVVTVLPQQAIDNLLASHVMDYVTSEKVNNSLASIENLVSLEIQNGVLGYKINGIKIHNLLGFIPIKTGVDAFVSAENGQVVESTESLLGRILNRLSL